MLWLPCTTSTSGNGHRLRIPHAAVDWQLLEVEAPILRTGLRDLGVADTRADPSTVCVLSATESRNADRRLSVPLPYTSVRTVNVPFSPGFGAEIDW
jgi:hypothetical protein